MNWLDTETKAILQKAQEPKLAPPKAAEFALVLIRKGADQPRLVRAIRRINGCGELAAMELSGLPAPLTIDAGLTEPEAIFGQFELICCDTVAAFIRSEVLLEQSEINYLDWLFQKVLESPEFKPTQIDVLAVPTTDAGEKFVDQFLDIPLQGQDRQAARFSVSVPFKKAKIMSHWAYRVGVQVRCAAVENLKDDEDVL